MKMQCVVCTQFYAIDNITRDSPDYHKAIPFDPSLAVMTVLAVLALLAVLAVYSALAVLAILTVVAVVALFTV